MHQEQLWLVDLKWADAFDGIQNFLVWHVFRVDDEVNTFVLFLLCNFPISQNGFLQYRLAEFAPTIDYLKLRFSE